MTVVVNVCIGCGAIGTPQPCLGTCADRRLDLVRADAHAPAQAGAAAAELGLEALREIVAGLARAAPGETEAAALRARARAALRTAGAAPEPAEVVTTWECVSCGRIEAPQPCVGVCVRPPVEMVPATEHAAVLGRDAAARAEITRLAPVARWLAWARPLPGQWERTAQALHARALSLGAR